MLNPLKSNLEEFCQLDKSQRSIWQPGEPVLDNQIILKNKNIVWPLKTMKTLKIRLANNQVFK